MIDKPHKRRPSSQEVVKRGQMFLVTDFQVGYAWDAANGTYPTIKFYDEDKVLLLGLRPEAIPALLEELPKWAEEKDKETKQ